MDTLALLRNLNPAWLASCKAFFGMNFNTLVTLLSERSSLSGNYQWKPELDANGRPLLHNVPVVILPSLSSATANAQGTVGLGDFSRCFRRVVKNSLTILRYSDAPGLAEYGIFAYEGFLRTSFGVLASASSDSPIKFLTQHA
jgi:HK97 family phage major capsid protein